MKGISRINRIRTMTTEELAKVIVFSTFITDYCTKNCEGCCNEVKEVECCIKWLGEEWEE